MKRKSNQRITKIKRDKILELLEHAESISVQSATTIQPLGSDLVPYPDMDRLRLWTNKYLLSGVNKIYPTKIDEQGNMYLTTIVDGLPLHTKMTKSISGLSEVTAKAINTKVLTTYGEPTFNQETGIVSGFSGTNLMQINRDYVAVGTEFCLCIIVGDTSITNANDPRTIAWSYSLLQIDQNGDTLKTRDEQGETDITIVSGLTTGQEVYVKSQYTDENTATIKYSFDGVEWTTVVENYNAPRTWGSTDDYSYKYWLGTNNNWHASERAFDGEINLSKSYVRLSSGLPEYLALDSSETITVSRETSKPGLWLSNLILPMNGDNNGYYLRHNKVHSNESSFDTFNSDTVGNYSFTFLQRAKIAEQDACNWVQNGCDVDFHADIFQRIYNMHFVPDRQSCVVYPSLQLWTPLFGRVYSTYQTIVTPSDPDMQFYQESNSKCLNFTNRLYSNNDELLDYSMKLVGKDWSYQFRVYPKYDEGGTDTIYGGCAEGSITYKSSSGTTCTQEVSSCFQSDQSLFNPDLPNDPNAKPLNSGDSTMISQSSTGCECTSGMNDYTEYNCDNGHPVLNDGKLYNVALSSTGLTEWIRCYDNATNYYSGKCKRCGLVRSGEIYAISTSRGSWKPGEGEIGPSTGGQNIRVSATLYFYNPSQPQTGVDIYLNIYDLKAEAEDQGLPWNADCGEARFITEFSTKKCNRPGCTSRLVASNVSIDELGKLSQFPDITIAG